MPAPAWIRLPVAPMYPSVPYTTTLPVKELLFEQVTNTLWEQSLKATELTFDADRDLRSQLIQIARQEVSLLAREEFQSISRVFISECINNPALAQQAMQYVQESESGISQWLQAAMDAGSIRQTDICLAQEQFMALIKAFTFWPQTLGRLPMPEAEELEQIITTGVDMFLAYYAEK